MDNNSVLCSYLSASAGYLNAIAGYLSASAGYLNVSAGYLSESADYLSAIYGYICVLINNFFYICIKKMMFRLRIKELLLSKGITNPYAWLRQQGIQHNSAYKLLGDHYHRLPLYHIATICRAAWCTPNDLLEYTTTTTKKIPKKAHTSPLPEGHPLHKLIARQSVNLHAVTAQLEESDLRELEQAAQELLNKKKNG